MAVFTPLLKPPSSPSSNALTQKLASRAGPRIVAPLTSTLPAYDDALSTYGIANTLRNGDDTWAVSRPSLRFERLLGWMVFVSLPSRKYELNHG
jgi:hypothetical protein